jgi:hypothetical protein
MKTNPMRKFLAGAAAAVALTALACTSGCLAVAAGAGTAVAYERGQLEATVGSDFERTANATNQALQQLGIAKVSERKDALVDTIIARNAADKKIEIRLENLAQNLTKVAFVSACSATSRCRSRSSTRSRRTCKRGARCAPMDALARDRWLLRWRELKLKAKGCDCSRPGGERRPYAG